MGGGHIQQRIRTDGVSWREVDGEIIALDLVSSTYFTTNKSGSLLWRELIEGSTPVDLVQSLCNRYDLSPEDAQQHVQVFLDSLRANGLLTTDG